MYSTIKYLTALFLIGTSLGCRHEEVVIKEDDWVFNPTVLASPRPPFFPVMWQPAHNLMTAEGVRLGRSLYYDNILSENGRSCSSCHWQQRAFTADRLVVGLDTGRFYEIMPHQNLGWKHAYNWTGNEALLEDVPHADFGPDFFNTDMTAMKTRLIRHASYPRRFYESFGVSIANYPDTLPDLITKALAQFLRSLVSANSSFDRFRLGQTDLSAAALRGYFLFFSERGECFHCHTPPFFTDHDFHDIGLEKTPSGRHEGRGLFTGTNHDRGKFATPSLRNIALTAPYMHDGRFPDMEAVVEFYSSGVQTSPNLDPLFYKQHSVPGLQLTPLEKADLVAFLHTLTDSSYLQNPLP